MNHRNLLELAAAGAESDQFPFWRGQESGAGKRWKSSGRSQRND